MMTDHPALIKLNKMLVVLSLLTPLVLCSCSEYLSSSVDNSPTHSNPDSTDSPPELQEPCYDFDEGSVLTYAENLEYFRTWRDSMEEKNLWDAHWWYMSDQELADSIAVSDNEVIIGFKEPYHISNRNADGSPRDIRDVTLQNAKNGSHRKQTFRLSGSSITSLLFMEKCRLRLPLSIPSEISLA